MTDIEILQSYRCAMMELDLLEKQFDRLNGTGAPDGYRAINLGEPLRGTNNHEAAAVQHADALEQLLEQKRLILRGIATRFEEILTNVNEPRMRLILRCYYAMGMTDEAIGEEIYMSTRRVNQLRNEFLHRLRTAG